MLRRLRSIEGITHGSGNAMVRSGTVPICDDAEDRGAGADAKSDDQDREGDKPGVAAQRAKRIVEILQEGIEERNAALLAVSLAELRDPAQFQPRSTTRLFRRHAAANMLLGQHGRVRFEFLLQFALERTGANRWSRELDTLQPSVPSRSTFPMTPETCSEFSVSAISCLRPAFERE
jgi:hypothetical protein